jgi:hypothetical protein
MSSPRPGPSRAFRRRDLHRRWLTLHLTLVAVVLFALFAVNRFLTPDTFWAHWVALAWLPVLIGHAAVFARSTLATMGGARR